MMDTLLITIGYQYSTLLARCEGNSTLKSLPSDFKESYFSHSVVFNFQMLECRFIFSFLLTVSYPLYWCASILFCERNRHEKNIHTYTQTHIHTYIHTHIHAMDNRYSVNSH